MTSKRVNFTLEEELHTEASKYAEDRGWTFSGLVARALTQYMQQGGDSSPGPAPALPLSKEELIQAMEETLRSDEGREYLKTLTREVVADLNPGEREPHVKRERITTISGLNAPKEGTVTISEEFRERLSKFGPSILERASGMSKGDISKIQRSLRNGISEKNYQKLEAGLISLEEAASKNGTLTSE